MRTIRLLAGYLFPTEKQVFQWYRRLFPSGNEPRWLEPVLWATMAALLLAIYALILF
jgi:hypothetical protein